MENAKDSKRWGARGGKRKEKWEYSIRGGGCRFANRDSLKNEVKKEIHGGAKTAHQKMKKNWLWTRRFRPLTRDKEG